MGQKNIVTEQKISPEKAQRARELRQNMTPAEKRLWDVLRANRLQGWHFRRQQIIDGFIVDFYCHKAGLVIEVDGQVHKNLQQADAEREVALTRRGLRVIRFTNQQAMSNLENVCEEILATLDVNLTKYS